MVSIGRTRKFFYYFGEWFYAVCMAAFAVLGWVSNIDTAQLNGSGRTFILAVVNKVLEYQLWLYFIFALLFIVAFVVRRHADPWVHDKLQLIIDKYQEKIFNNFGPKDHHRVTIFKHVRKRFWVRHWSARKFYRPSGDKPLLSDYLIPVMRSGHLAKKSRAVFYAPDHSDKAEGVAGRAWSEQVPVLVQGLPDIQGRKALARDKKEYAMNTKTDMALVERYIEDGRPPPRSLAAMPIECNGKPWGVVVLDSRNPNGVTRESIDNYSLTLALISELTERA